MRDDGSRRRCDRIDGHLGMVPAGASAAVRLGEIHTTAASGAFEVPLLRRIGEAFSQPALRDLVLAPPGRANLHLPARADRGRTIGAGGGGEGGGSAAGRGLHIGENSSVRRSHAPL